MKTIPFLSLKNYISNLYYADTSLAHKFRYGLLIFDLLTVGFIVTTSFIPELSNTAIDIIIGSLLVIDFTARLWINKRRLRMLFSIYSVLDIIVIVSLFAPIMSEGLAFLRILRALRLLRTYQILSRLRQDFRFFKKNEKTLLASLNLAVFVFIMTAIVYETQNHINAKIDNYADALYFTVTALTTTGFGDIVLEGTNGRLISVVIMIFGVSLFLRLIQVILRPEKVEFKCSDCGLLNHDRDAVHCKACGKLLNIPDEGEV